MAAFSSGGRIVGGEGDRRVCRCCRFIIHLLPKSRREAASRFSTGLACGLPSAVEFYAMPAATQALLNDAAIDIETWTPARSTSSLLSRKVRPSLPAMAPTSRKASCPARRSPIQRGARAISVMLQRVQQARSRLGSSPAKVSALVDSYSLARWTGGKLPPIHLPFRRLLITIHSS
jgi:hypothetical protein